jgi:hypothetical protein
VTSNRRFRIQRRIPGLRRETRGAGLHPEARKDLDTLAKSHNVSKAWLAAYMIEVFMYGEGNTYAEDPTED